MLQFLSDNQQLFVSFSSPGNLIVSQCTRINYGDTWRCSCLGFGCDLISSHSADYLALFHCLCVPRGYPRKVALCPAQAPIVAWQGHHTCKNKTHWNFLNRARWRPTNPKYSRQTRQWGIFCSSSCAQSAVSVPHQPLAHVCWQNGPLRWWEGLYSFSQHNTTQCFTTYNGA